MEALVLLAIVLGLGIWLGRRSRRSPPAALKRVAEASAPEVVFSTSVRKIDENAYRFDGIARPEFRIRYKDEGGEITERDVYVYRYAKRQNVTHFVCWCFLRDEQRVFRADRIEHIRNLATGREIRDLEKYLERP